MGQGLFLGGAFFREVGKVGGGIGCFVVALPENRWPLLTRFPKGPSFLPKRALLLGGWGTLQRPAAFKSLNKMQMSLGKCVGKHGCPLLKMPGFGLV